MTHSPISQPTPSIRNFSGVPCISFVVFPLSTLSHSRRNSTDSLNYDEQFPVLWIVLLFVGLLKFNISFLPIVMLALVFNLTNSIGYTYAVRRSPQNERLHADGIEQKGPRLKAEVGDRSVCGIGNVGWDWW